MGLTEHPGSATVLAAVVYASTNVDDLLILAVFFADARARIAAVVAGRYLALAALVLAALAAALLALAVPQRWLALLGLVPLLLGLRLLLALRRGPNADGPDEAAADVPRGSGGGGKFVPQAVAVAGVSLANSADNLAVYIPLFAAMPESIAVYVLVFAIMTALWCALGYLLVRNRLWGARIRQSGHLLLPIVLIGLGIHILAGLA